MTGWNKSKRGYEGDLISTGKAAEFYPPTPEASAWLDENYTSRIIEKVKKWYITCHVSAIDGKEYGVYRDFAGLKPYTLEQVKDAIKFYKEQEFKKEKRAEVVTLRQSGRPIPKHLR